MTTIHRLKITLRDVKPPVWRRIEVRSSVTLDELEAVGDKARWAYDFGDGWEHDVVVEAICELDPDAVYPRCIKGRCASRATRDRCHLPP